MKKTTLFFTLIAMLFILTSCGISENDGSFKDMSNESFFKNIILPEKLFIDINLDSIKKFDEAKSYMAKYIDFNKLHLIDAFIKTSITEEKIWAEGPQVIASDGNIFENLNIYDGGKSFGVENGMRGGFIYTKKTVFNSFYEKLNTVATVSFEDPDGYAQLYGYGLNSDYTSYSDLNFLPYKDALADTEEALRSVGISQVAVDESYSLDLETMQAHYQAYLDRGWTSDEHEIISWTKDDECYIFSLNQLVNNIPIVNKSWQMPDGSKASVWGNAMPATSIQIIYDKTGIRSMEAFNILEISSETESKQLISLYEALKTLIDNYSLTILEEDTRIISAKLCYLSIPKEKNLLELVPGWLFRSAKTNEIEGVIYTQYKYDAVNAITGQLYLDRW